jgi:hypothetical protein
MTTLCGPSAHDRSAKVCPGTRDSASSAKVRAMRRNTRRLLATTCRHGRMRRGICRWEI